jgi:hypothetical protein
MADFANGGISSASGSDFESIWGNGAGGPGTADDLGSPTTSMPTTSMPTTSMPTTSMPTTSMPTPSGRRLLPPNLYGSASAVPPGYAAGYPPPAAPPGYTPQTEQLLHTPALSAAAYGPSTAPTPMPPLAMHTPPTTMFTPLYSTAASSVSSAADTIGSFVNNTLRPSLDEVRQKVASTVSATKWTWTVLLILGVLILFVLIFSWVSMNKKLNNILSAVALIYP